MLKECLIGEAEVNRRLLDEYKIQGDVIMRIQLPDYCDFRGFGLESEMELSSGATRICGPFPQTIAGALKHHLYKM